MVYIKNFGLSLKLKIIAYVFLFFAYTKKKNFIFWWFFLIFFFFFGGDWHIYRSYYFELDKVSYIMVILTIWVLILCFLCIISEDKKNKTSVLIILINVLFLFLIFFFFFKKVFFFTFLWRGDFYPYFIYWSGEARE